MFTVLAQQDGKIHFSANGKGSHLGRRQHSEKRRVLGSGFRVDGTSYPKFGGLYEPPSERGVRVCAIYIL